MPKSIPDLVHEIEALQEKLEHALEARRDAMEQELEERSAALGHTVSAYHASLRRTMSAQLRAAPPLVLLTAPVIYSVAIPFALLDLFVSLYQTICFPVYRIPKVKRSAHVFFDRQYLSYLNGIEKLNCMYCAYATGVISYTQEVTSRTEQYWCPIKHARRVLGAHSRYANFFEYGDAEGYRERRKELREDLRAESEEPKEDSPAR